MTQRFELKSISKKNAFKRCRASTGFYGIGGDFNEV